MKDRKEKIILLMDSAQVSHFVGQRTYNRQWIMDNGEFQLVSHKNRKRKVGNVKTRRSDVEAHGQEYGNGHNAD